MIKKIAELRKLAGETGIEAERDRLNKEIINQLRRIDGHQAAIERVERKRNMRVW